MLTIILFVACFQLQKPELQYMEYGKFDTSVKKTTKDIEMPSRIYHYVVDSSCAKIGKNQLTHFG